MEDKCDIWMKPGHVVNHRKKLKKKVVDAVKKVRWVGSPGLQIKRLCADNMNVGEMKKFTLNQRNVLEDEVKIRQNNVRMNIGMFKNISAKSQKNKGMDSVLRLNDFPIRVVTLAIIAWV